MARSRSRVHLMPEERENLEIIIAAAREEVGTGDTGFIANRALGRLATAERRGERWARSAMEYFAEQGLQVHVKDEMRGDDLSQIRLSGTGQVISIASRIGVQARNEDGVTEKYHQQEFWWVVLWSTLADKVANYIKQRNTIDTNIAVFGEVFKLRDRFPDTLTAEEACEMAGIDPRAFGIEGDVFAV